MPPAIPSLTVPIPGSYDIYGVDTKSGIVKRVTLIADADEYNPSFAPDGEHIVHDVVGGPAALGHSLYITDVSSGVSVPLTGGEGGNDASWSPDSMTIAFDRNPVGDQSIYVVPVGGGTRTLVRAGALDPEWSNNSQRLVFRDVNDGSVRTVDLSGGSETTVASAGSNPSWSPNGKAIAFSDGENIFTVAVNQAGKPKGLPVQVTSDGGFGIFNQQPSWSNNGKTIVFHSNRVTGDFDIWTVSASGGTPKLLAGNSSYGDYDPSYSRNGKQVAYAGFTLAASPVAPAVPKAAAEQWDAGRMSVADRFELAQNYPNPFNPTTTIQFALPNAAHVSLEVFDALGRRVAQLVEGEVSRGFHDVAFDGTGLSSGIYFYRLIADDEGGQHFMQIRKLILMK